MRELYEINKSGLRIAPLKVLMTPMNNDHFSLFAQATGEAVINFTIIVELCCFGCHLKTSRHGTKWEKDTQR